MILCVSRFNFVVCPTQPENNDQFLAEIFEDIWKSEAFRKPIYQTRLVVGKQARGQGVSRGGYH